MRTRALLLTVLSSTVCAAPAPAQERRRGAATEAPTTVLCRR